MENKMLTQLCNNLDYNTYLDIRDSLWIAGALGLSAHDSFLHQYPMADLVVASLSLLAFNASLFMSLSNGETHTKNFRQIKELYEEFIVNYNKLNKLFDLKNPIQVYSMFDYLLCNGFLSKDKDFKFSSTGSKDITDLPGIDVILGRAVCRHIAPMLCDILNNYGIDACTFHGYSSGYGDKILSPSDLLGKVLGNHVITFAYQDGKCYYLDSTNSVIYRASDTRRKTLCCDSGEFSSRMFSLMVDPSRRDCYAKLKRDLLGQSSALSEDEEQLLDASTLDTCMNNLDVFDQFYRENSELYDDISSIASSLKSTTQFTKRR